MLLPTSDGNGSWYYILFCAMLVTCSLARSFVRSLRLLLTHSFGAAFVQHRFFLLFCNTIKRKLSWIKVGCMYVSELWWSERMFAKKAAFFGGVFIKYAIFHIWYKIALYHPAPPSPSSSPSHHSWAFKSN